jgi:O-antigen ligase
MMGKAIFFLFAAIIVFQIFRLQGVRKLPWFFAGILFFPLTINIWPSPPISIPRLAVYSLLATTLFRQKNWYKEYRAFPLKSSMLFILVMLLMVGIFSRINLFSKFFIPIDLFIKNFFVMFLTYYYVRSIDDINYIFKTILSFFVVFCIYGFANYLTERNQYYDFITDTFNAIDIPNYFMSYARRFRISSFAWHPIYYGFILALATLINIYVSFLREKKRNLKAFNLILFMLLLGNLFLTNSRTPLLAFVAGAAIVFLFAMNWRLKIRLIILCSVLVGSAAMVFPSVSKLFVESYKTFSDEGSELEGSSVEMRLTQMNASLREFNKSPVLGNGFGYISQVLGFSADKSKRNSDEDFAGFESYAYKLLIEQGLCGMVGNAIFFFALFAYFYKNMRKEKSHKISLLSISMLIVFLLFIFGTGDMGTFIVCMSVIGLNVRYALILSEDRAAEYVELTNYPDKMLAFGYQ